MSPRASRVAWLLLMLFLGAVVVVDAVTVSPYNLVSLAGLVTFVLFSFLFSARPGQVDWGVVGASFTLQLTIGLIIMRWQTGNDLVAGFAALITGFLNYAYVGAEYVFGPTFGEHGFAIGVMPLLCFFTAVTSVFYYAGVLQVIMKVIGEALEWLIGAGQAESFVTAANVFFGPDVSIIMIQSTVPTLSRSQLFTLFCSGLATIDAGMFPIYESIGVPADQLVSASMITAPAVIMFSKLIIPDSRRHRRVTNGKPEKSRRKLIFNPTKHVSVLDAFCGGAIDAVQIIGQVVVVLLACISLLEFVNATLTWFGDRVGIEQLTVQLICSYVFMPVSFLLGVPWSDCGHVARLIGVKSVINEYVAYMELAELIQNRQMNITPSIEPRSEAIAAYALCGYSNIATVAVLIALLSSLAPAKSGLISGMATRAFVAGTLACLSTACTAGLFYQ